METFSAFLAICAGNSPVTGEFPAQRPMMRSFDVFFDLRLNKGWVNNRDAVMNSGNGLALQWNLNQNYTKLSFQENVICKMLAILLKPQWVKPWGWIEWWMTATDLTWTRFLNLCMLNCFEKNLGMYKKRIHILYHSSTLKSHMNLGIILWMCPANEGWRYKHLLVLSLIHIYGTIWYHKASLSHNELKKHIQKYYL